MKNINEKELENYILKMLKESYFDELEFDDSAMKAAMADINADPTAGDFEELGTSKFEKDPKFKSKLKSSLKQANLELPSDEAEVEYYVELLRKRKAQEDRFGKGSLNELEKFENITDSKGNPIKLKSQVEDVETGILGYVERLKQDDETNKMFVKVNWIKPDNTMIPSIVNPKTLIATLQEENTIMNEEAYESTRYMFFSNLEQIRRQADLLLDMDEDQLNSILENGHDWAQDHIATAKESIDQVFDFLMNETSEGDTWNSDDIEKEEEFEEEIEEGIGHSHTIGKGTNEKPVNYPETLMREAVKDAVEEVFGNYTSTASGSVGYPKTSSSSYETDIEKNLGQGIKLKDVVSSIKNVLKGTGNIKGELEKLRMKNWKGTPEGWHEFISNKKYFSGTNESIEEDMDKTDYQFNKAMLDYEAQEDLNREYSDDDRYEEVVFLQDHEANHALNILKQDGEDEAMQYLMQWHQPGNHETSNETGFGSLDKTYEKDGYIMYYNPQIGYIGLIHDSSLDEDSQRKRHTAGQIGKVSKNIPLGQHAPHSDSALGL